jgi:hypothetical protein
MNQHGANPYGLPTQYMTKLDRNSCEKKVNMTIHKKKITWHITAHMIHPYLTIVPLQQHNFKKYELLHT